MKEPVYWTTKDGTKMNVDDMDDNHIRNAFKMLLRNIEKLKTNAEKKSLGEFLELRGEMAIDLMETGMMDEMDEDFGFDPNWD